MNLWMGNAVAKFLIRRFEVIQTVPTKSRRQAADLALS
jgi:hypothetical protein